MNWLPAVMFTFNITLLLLHEMDAIRAKEWKMFIILNRMREETAYIVFSLIHLPLYALVIFVISQSGSTAYALVWLIVDVFLVAHAIIHFLFRKHRANGFHSIYSMLLIYGMGIFAIIHLLLII